MQNEARTLYYTNDDRQPGARIARDMMACLCHGLTDVMDSPVTRAFVANTRIPNERELYGVVIKALLTSMPEGLGHIATEVQVARVEQDKNSKGRVDLLFEYRNVSFLLELKTARASVRSKAMLDENDAPLARRKLIKPWQEAALQLQQLDTGSLGEALKKKIIKLPLVMYLHTEMTREAPHEDWKAQSMSTHAEILSQLDAWADRESQQPCHFHYCAQWQQGALRTAGRRQCLMNDEPGVNFYGISIVAGIIDDAAVPPVQQRHIDV